jgi:hypothetical protein
MRAVSGGRAGGNAEVVESGEASGEKGRMGIRGAWGSRDPPPKERKPAPQGMGQAAVPPCVYLLPQI